MGLSLRGTAFFFTLTDKQLKTHPKEHVFELAYWPKYSGLHAYIVEQFTEGEDTYQDVDLDTGDLFDIISAIDSDRLPHTEESSADDSANHKEQKAQAIELFGNAIDWLMVNDGKTRRSVSYRGSW